MLGETVTVWRREQTETDAMGEPIYSWTGETVEDCVIRPSSGADLKDALRPDGVRVTATVAFPKTYNNRDSLAYCRLTFRDMQFDEALYVSGHPTHIEPCPTKWDTLAEAGRVDG